MPGVKVVSVYLCSHAEVEYVDDNDDPESPVYNFHEAPCSQPGCSATDIRLFTAWAGAADLEEQDSVKYLWRQLGNLRNQLGNIIVVFDTTNPNALAQLAAALLKGSNARILEFFICEDRFAKIDEWLSEPHDLLKHAQQFQRHGSSRPFFEYCLNEATSQIDDAKKDVAELKTAVRGLVPDRVAALRRDVSVRPTRAGPRTYWKRDEKQVESLVLGVRSMAITKTKAGTMDGLARGMKDMRIKHEKRVRFVEV